MTATATRITRSIARHAACLAGLWITVPAIADPCLPVQVQNLRPEQGTVMVAAYTSAQEFQKKPISALQVRVSSTTMNLQLCLPDGAPAVSSLALMLYQDLNDNGKLDANLLGMPSEPWGASGKPSTFGAPTWDSAQLPLDGKPIVVKLSQ